MQPAPLKRRAAALVYESLTAGSVTAAAAVPAGVAVTAAQYGAPALLPAAPAFASAVFLWAWWLYFSLNWLREGQTLPMRVWNIGLAAVLPKNGCLSALRGHAYCWYSYRCCRMQDCKAWAGTGGAQQAQRYAGGCCRGALHCSTRDGSFCMTCWQERNWLICAGGRRWYPD